MPKPVNLDEMMKTARAAHWLQIGERELLSKSGGVRPVIPAFHLNRRVVRFHPRTIIAKLASDAGVSPEIIAASMMLNEERRT